MAEAKKAGAAKAEATLEFNTLYLDTNVLIESNWPAVSVRLGSLLELAKRCNVTVVIPKPVEKGTQERWLREIRNSKERVQEIPLSEIGVRGPLETLDRVLGVRSVKPLYVQTPMPDPKNPNRSVRFAIAITADSDVSGTRPQVSLRDLLLGVGARTILSGPPQQEAQTATWFGGIEAAAEVRARQYTNVKLLSLVSAEEIGSRKWFKAAAENEKVAKPAAR